MMLRGLNICPKCLGNGELEVSQWESRYGDLAGTRACIGAGAGFLIRGLQSATERIH